MIFPAVTYYSRGRKDLSIYVAIFYNFKLNLSLFELWIKIMRLKSFLFLNLIILDLRFEKLIVCDLGYISDKGYFIRKSH